LTRREIKNVAASVHQRLLDRALEQNRPFQTVLQRCALERWLYRLSESSHADRFVLKGALMLLVWRAPVARHTLDIVRPGGRRRSWPCCRESTRTSLGRLVARSTR